MVVQQRCVLLCTCFRLYSAYLGERVYGHYDHGLRKHSFKCCQLGDLAKSIKNILFRSYSFYTGYDFTGKGGEMTV